MICQIAKNTAGTVLAALLLACIPPAGAAEPLLKIHSRSGDPGEPIWAIPAGKQGTDPAFIYRSNDGGATWETTNPLPSRSTRPASITSISSVMTAWDAIYVLVGTDGEGVYRSTDLGDTWAKWNDADIGISAVDGGERSSYLGSLTTDGATFLTQNSGNEWTQLHDAPLSATALTQYGSTTTVGTSAGEIIEIDNSHFVITNLTSSADGVITPLPGPVQAVVNNSGNWLMAIVERSNGTRKLYNGRGVSAGQPWALQQVSSATETIIDIAGSGTGLVAVISEDPNPVLYVSSDNGITWIKASLPVSNGINDIDSAYCNSYNCISTLFLATDEGGFVSHDRGTTWTALADTAAAGPLTGTTADSDLGIEMVSPAWNTSQVSRRTSRFELRVANAGPENVTDITVELEFTIWREGSNFGSASWGTGTTIDGGNCAKDHDRFSNPIWLCTLSELAANESAELVLIHGLPTDGTSMRIEAYVDAENLRDSFSANDNVLFSPLIRDTTEAAGSSGGGGAFGLFGLLLLLATAGRRFGRDQDDRQLLNIPCTAEFPVPLDVNCMRIYRAGRQHFEGTRHVVYERPQTKCVTDSDSWLAGSFFNVGDAAGVCSGARRMGHGTGVPHLLHRRH
jgi:hypothetical protein